MVLRLRLAGKDCVPESIVGWAHDRVRKNEEEWGMHVWCVRRR